MTAAVTANGPVSFALTTTSSNSSYYTSREGTNKPQLVITPQSPTTALAAFAGRAAARTATFFCPLAADGARAVAA